MIVPMSGAVQKRILDIASHFRASVLYGAYISGNASDAAGQDMMRANAAPTLMDTWAVLHRRSTHTLLALNQAELGETLRVLEAYCYINGATVLKIGQTEPWVVSNASDTGYYEDRFGVKIVPVAQEELEDLFLATTREQAATYFDWFTGHSQGRVEPTREDIWNAFRMACALVTLLEKYHAAGAALACFNLLRTGTNACLGVSYVNNGTDMCVGCECDMDSTITMLLMKKLTDTRLWMANPGDSSGRNHQFQPLHQPGVLYRPGGALHSAQSPRKRDRCQLAGNNAGKLPRDGLPHFQRGCGCDHSAGHVRSGSLRGGVPHPNVCPL